MWKKSLEKTLNIGEIRQLKSLAMAFAKCPLFATFYFFLMLILFSHKTSHMCVYGHFFASFLIIEIDPQGRSF